MSQTSTSSIPSLQTLQQAFQTLLLQTAQTGTSSQLGSTAFAGTLPYQQAFWQAHTLYWETFGSIMQQRLTTFGTLWQQAPGWQQRLAACTTFNEFCSVYQQWLASATSSTSTLTQDVLTQRGWLWQQWQQLASRTQRTTSSSNNAACSLPTTTTASTMTSAANSATAASASATNVTTLTQPIPAPVNTAATTTATVTPITTATAASVSRSSSQTAGMASSTSARRSVIASRRSRSRRVARAR